VSRLTKKTPVRDVTLSGPGWVVDPATGWPVWACQKGEHPPYVPGRWEREQDERIERGEAPRTDPPPRERSYS
jgi:hypothetical protein